ncbi:MAG: hypothetical protein JRI68_17255 [Deltaproteobacteria bacterium]|nr:hypothetical protein [Deltaproteobacteria bacterium]
MWLVAAAIAVWIVAAYFATTGPRSLLGKDQASAPASAPREESPAPGTASVSASKPSAAPTAAPEASTEAEPIDTSTCVVALFPTETFKKTPNFAFLCTKDNPRTGGTDVRARVVLGAGGKVTDGMREWAGLGWYEAAAYGVLRARCCPSPAPLKWSFNLVCPVDQSVAKLQKGVVARDAAAVDGAVKDYSKQVRCLSKFGQATNFGQTGSPGPGVTLLKRFIDRALGASPKSKK